MTIAIAAVVLLLLPPHAARALHGLDVTADGLPLAGTVQLDGDFTLEVAAPIGVKVKFKIDGTYLGQDNAAPYTWPIHTTVGSHSVNVRWDDADGRHEASVAFIVGTATGSSTPSTSPSPAPPAAAPGGSTVAVSTSAQLTAALKAATPGQTIALRDGTYVGQFVASASGTASQRITLTGSRAAVLTTGTMSSGYGLRVTAPYWNIVGLSVSVAAKGIVLEGSHHTVIDGVDVGNTGAEAVHLRKNSAFVIVRNSRIHDTGRIQSEYGEGIYVGSASGNWSSIMGSSSTPDRSDSVQILGNTIVNTTAEGIDIKEGTTGGVVTGNTFTNAGYSGDGYADSWVDVKGNGYRITGNSGSTALRDGFQVHVVANGWGRDNHFRDNAVRGGVPGHEVWVQSGAAGTVVACGVTMAAKGMSNIACTP
ncbi:MAG: right-handed parallel beta-helix repeat-containing protein [Microbacterium sp.]